MNLIRKTGRIFREHKGKNFLRFICFCFVGGTSALIGITCFNAFFWIGLGFISAWILATFLSVIYNFSMNRNITFSAKEGLIKKQLTRYGIVYGSSISVNFIVSIIAVSLLGEGVIQANIAIVMGIAASIPVGFFGSLLWDFKKENASIMPDF